MTNFISEPNRSCWTNSRRRKQSWHRLNLTSDLNKMFDGHFRLRLLKPKKGRMPWLRNRFVYRQPRQLLLLLMPNQARRPFVLVLIDADADGFMVRTLGLS
jgi:hypothetical protein